MSVIHTRPDEICGLGELCQNLRAGYLRAANFCARSAGWARACRDRSDLTEGISQMALEGQLSHKIVNLLFTVTNQNVNLTALRGGGLSKSNESIHRVW